MDRWEEIRKIFDEALQLSPDTRQNFLERTCNDDQDLLHEVQSLLAAHEESPSFLERPVVAEMPEFVQQATRAFQPGQFLGGYRIIDWIGQGGMGEVYRARDIRLKRDVAIKTLPKDFAMNADRLRRFEVEARSAAALNHPNIISVYDMGVVGGCPYLVSELLLGRTLREVLDAGPVAPEKALDLATQLARGLSAAHDSGIVHRDLKPENLFVLNDGRLKILDFGLAKLTIQSVDLDSGTNEGRPFETEIGKVFGTVGYMSPEQIRGQRVDHRSDIFSAGAILWELFSRQKAFRGESPADIASAILHEDPGKLQGDVLPIIDSTIRRALEKAPEKRFQSAHDLASRLQAASTLYPRPRFFLPRLRAMNLQRPAVILVSLGVLLFSAFGLVRYIQLRQPSQPKQLSARDTVVLADFVNTTGEEVFDAPLRVGLSKHLEQSPFLNVLSESKIYRQLRFMKRTPGEHLTVGLAREVCQREGGKAVLEASISRLGSHFRIALRVLSCRSGDVLASELLEADSREEILDTLGEAANSMRVKLGESLLSVEKYNTPLASATTASLQALQVYTTALQTARADGEEAALGLFKRALELDPGFTMAYSQLALSYYDLSQFTISAEYAEKAYQMRSKVTEKERLFIESFYQESTLGNFEKAAKVYEEWQRTYPEDITAANNLGTIQSYLGQYDAAAANGREALRKDREYPDHYSNLAGYYFGLNRMNEAAATLDEADRAGLHSGLLLNAHYQLAFLQGDTKRLDEIVSSVAGNESTETDILALHSASHAYYGRLKQARELSDRVISSARRRNANESAAIWSATAALCEAEFGNYSGAKRRAAAALQLAAGRIDKPVVAFALARTGYQHQAEAIAQDLHRQFPEDTILNYFWLPAIKAAMALKQNNPARSLEILKAARYEFGNPPPGVGLLYAAYLRGEAYLALRNGRSAAAEFQKIVEHPGIVVNSPLGILANLQIGRANVLTGDAENARISYEKFLTLWKEADKDVPILKMAQAEYANFTVGNQVGSGPKAISDRRLPSAQ